MNSHYEPKHIEKLFNISSATVRVWANEFKEFLSPRANPEANKHRMFTVGDVEVLALVSDMRGEKHGYEAIKVALAQGQRGEAPPLPPSDIVALTLSQEGQEFIAMMENLVNRVEQLERQADSRDREELDKAREEIRRLDRLIGGLENENKRLREQLEDDD